MASNVYVIGMDDYNKHLITNSQLGHNYNFHTLYTYDEVKGDQGHYPVRELWQNIDNKLNEADPKIDGVIGFWDFPVTCLQAMIADHAGLHGPHLEQVLRCEHKYWSRCLQQEVVPEITPNFQLLDPFDNQAFHNVSLPYPFWLKPVKSAGSYLGFKIHNDYSLRSALETIRQEINHIADPFNFILEKADLPEAIQQIAGHYCIAESTLTGKMCTVEGYVHNGRVAIHGLVASVKDMFGHSFFYYRYPLQPPAQISYKIKAYTHAVMEHIGLDNCAFNIEYFYDELTEQIGLLEINPRISQSHAYMFEQVDGLPNHSVITQLALGQEPEFPHGQGDNQQAAKFFLRYYQDGWVYYLPDEQKLKEVEALVPGSKIVFEVEQSMWLSELTEQDSYSYEVAHIYTVGQTETELIENYERLVEALAIDIH